MVAKKMKKFISILTIPALICSSLFCKNNVKAAVNSDSYNKEISIGFTSMGNLNTLDFTLTDNYIMEKQNIILKKDMNYRIDLKSSTFTIYENNIPICMNNEDIIIKPLNISSYIMFRKEVYMRRFKGNITLKKLSDKEFIPVNSLGIEDYVKGVLPFEESNDFPIEALKAQAVAARTYAIANRGKYSAYGYDLTDDTSSQVYRGYVENASNCNSAVDSTEGSILTYNGQPISAYFSSSNGGYTEQNDNVWSGNQLPYLIEKADPFDTHDKGWIAQLKTQDIEALLRKNHAELSVKQLLSLDIANIKKYPSGRISELKILYNDNNNVQQSLVLSKGEARNFFGLKSALYTVTLSKDSTNGDIYTFTGSGYGHGIGMSQWGAYGRAVSGQDYKTILAFYYNNTSLERIGTDAGKIHFTTRIGGKDRFETSELIAEKAYEGTINNIVIANGNNFPDALSGSVLAKKLDSPLIIVNNTTETSVKAFDYIKAHLSKNGHVYILGGEGSISSSFVDRFKELGFNSDALIRIGGKDRYETSALIAAYVSQSEGVPVVISTGNDFPDSLSVSAAAAKNGWPILLVSGSEIESSVKNYISSYKPSQVYIIGGTGAVDKKIEISIQNMLNNNVGSVKRLGGSDRYETSAIVNNAFVSSTSNVIITSGLNFPDALSGSIFAANNGAAMLLADSKMLIPAQNYLKLLIQSQRSVNLTVFGLQGAVSDDVINNLTAIK